MNVLYMWLENDPREKGILARTYKLFMEFVRLTYNVSAILK